MSPTQEAAMKMALEALEVAAVSYPVNRHKAALALRAALAEPVEPAQEPVAKCIDDICSEHLGRVEAFDHLPRGTLLYALLPQRKPLSAADALRIATEAIGRLQSAGPVEGLVGLVRAVEAAHSIK